MIEDWSLIIYTLHCGSYHGSIHYGRLPSVVHMDDAHYIYKYTNYLSCLQWANYCKLVSWIRLALVFVYPWITHPKALYWHLVIDFKARWGRKQWSVTTATFVFPFLFIINYSLCFLVWEIGYEFHGLSNFLVIAKPQSFKGWANCVTYEQSCITSKKIHQTISKSNFYLWMKDESISK
jgi:hypothetical protein